MLTEVPLSDGILAARYPRLYAAQRWEWAGVDAQFCTVEPPDELVTNIHIVAYVDDQIILCRDARDVWFLPGGTREPQETVADCVARELVEEAGARLAGPLTTVGAHYCISDHAHPYRPHQPHPEKVWLWCTANTVVIQPPTMPPGGERIVEVRAFPVLQAAELVTSDEPWMAELVTLAHELRSTIPMLKG
jgi:8-oxo-dGTP diphosphatase